MLLKRDTSALSGELRASLFSVYGGNIDIQFNSHLKLQGYASAFVDIKLRVALGRVKGHHARVLVLTISSHQSTEHPAINLIQNIIGPLDRRSELPQYIYAPVAHGSREIRRPCPRGGP